MNVSPNDPQSPASAHSFSRKRLLLTIACSAILLVCTAAFAIMATSRIEIPATQTIDANAMSLTLQAAAAQAQQTAESTATPEPPSATPTSAEPPATPAIPTPAATATPTATPWPTPHPPAALLPWPKTLNIVLLGTDRRPGESDWRTDTMIIVAIEPDTKQVGVIAVPRDLWIDLPNYSNRINTLDFVGGPQFLKQALQYEFGIPIHYYARVQFDGFV